VASPRRERARCDRHLPLLSIAQYAAIHHPLNPLGLGETGGKVKGAKLVRSPVPTDASGRHREEGAAFEKWLPPEG
jgi:hypothetical protein